MCEWIVRRGRIGRCYERLGKLRKRLFPLADNATSLLQPIFIYSSSWPPGSRRKGKRARRGWCADDPFALPSKWVLRARSGIGLVPASLPRANTSVPFSLKKRKKIGGLVVIRTVRPHGLLEGVLLVARRSILLRRTVTGLCRPVLLRVFVSPPALTRDTRKRVLPLHS